MAQANATDRIFRNFAWLWVGLLLVAMSLLPLGGYVRTRDELAEIRSQAPVSAKVVTAERRNGGRYGGLYTDTVLEFQRRTATGTEHCKVSKKLEGWSDDVLVGRTISVVPRSRNCFDPIVPRPEHASPHGALIFFAAVLAAGAASMLVWLVRWRRARRHVPTTDAD